MRSPHDHPHHDTRGGSVINDNGKPVHFYDVRADDERPFVPEQHNEPDWAAVRALLNDYYRDGTFDPTLLIRTDPEAKAFDRITHAIDWRADLDEARTELGKALAALSPEERAEFDRRTT